MVIEVKNIRRSFRSPSKAEGVKGALSLLFNPKYQEHEALKGVSFSIETGSFTGLIGANGAGKTTLLKILSGLIPPSSGEARVLGYDPFRRALDFRRKIALVMGQKAQLWWDLPAIDAFDLLRAIYEIPLPLYKERLHTLTELLDIQKHLSTQIRRLSLGERMKMELVGAILHWPSVIFLDEPTIGLDVLAAHKLREFLKVFNSREKATIILTSHNMDDIEKLCSRVLILKSGELIYDGRPDGLIKRGGAHKSGQEGAQEVAQGVAQEVERCLRIRLFEKPSLSELAQVTGLPVSSIEEMDAEESDSKVIHFNIMQNQIVSVLQSVMKQFQIVDMGIEEPSLEKVIQRIYAEEQENL